ncbi:MAG: hypothetical protein K2W92_08375, partial [Alphaproteobacteria bacterium]|nr:hypothetical protein [Alphaproteobacteria bacterium]
RGFFEPYHNGTILQALVLPAVLTQVQEEVVVLAQVQEVVVEALAQALIQAEVVEFLPFSRRKH